MATLKVELENLATRISTECKALRVLLNNNSADNSALVTTAKSNLVAAINEVHALALAASGSGGADINDAATNTVDAWSSQKITDYVAAQVAVIMGGVSPETLNTIDELAAAFGDDPNAIASITLALSKRVRFDAAQTLTGPEKAQACSNMGAAALADTGALDTDYVAIFEAGLL